VHLVAEYGFTRQLARANCSVAVDRQVSDMADVPDFVVCALLARHPRRLAATPKTGAGSSCMLTWTR
jgi:acetamidase/formamidase